MSRKQPSELDRLFSIASSQTTREQSSINPNLDSTEVTNCISFKGDQLFHSQPPLSAPPGLTTIIPHSLQHASTRDKVSSKFALPPPGFPQHNASAMDYTQSASILELSDHMKSLSKKEETFKEPCMTSCLDPHRNGKIAMHPQAFPEHHNLQKYPTISLPHAMSDRPYWLMTDREVRHIWRISMTPVISTLCKSSCDVNSHRDNFLPENLTNLFLNEAGGIEYPDNYTGDDFYFARYISRKGPTTGKDRTAPVGNLLLIPTVPQTRPGRKVSKVPPISNEVHLKSILPHVPKLANRSEKIVDGALGKISLNSLRHPKRSISIDSKSAAPISKLVENGAFSKMASLAIAEKTYQDLNGECGEQSFLSLISDSHTLLSLVQTPKGKRTIPLIISAISSSESLSSSACLLSIFQTILCNLCLFLSSTSGSPLHHVDYIKDNDAATVESILTPFVSFLSQLSIAEIFELSEKNYHSARPSTTHFHFQVEHSLQTDRPNLRTFEERWDQVSESIFNSLCISFPAMLSPPFTTSTQQTEDDLFYAWQFLALLSAHISSTNCHMLVNVLRDQILAAANSGLPESVRNVNLLLNMIGLDASQLVQKRE